MIDITKIHLRAVEPSDAMTLFRWENDTSLWNCGNTAAPYSLQQLMNYAENYDGDIFSSRQLRLMIADEESDNTLGCVDLYDFDPIHRRAGVGIYVDTPYRALGIGKMAIAELSRYASIRLGMHQLWCVTAVDNIAAIKLFESYGYKISGRLRSWIRIGESYRDAFILQSLEIVDSHS